MALSSRWATRRGRSSSSSAWFRPTGSSGSPTSAPSRARATTRSSTPTLGPALADGRGRLGAEGAGRPAPCAEGLAQPRLAQRELSRLCRLHADAGVREALEQLIAASRAQRAAIMCAEAVPWRCHRSLVADALLVRGVTGGGDPVGGQLARARADPVRACRRPADDLSASTALSAVTAKRTRGASRRRRGGYARRLLGAHAGSRRPAAQLKDQIRSGFLARRRAQRLAGLALRLLASETEPFFSVAFGFFASLLPFN